MGWCVCACVCGMCVCCVGGYWVGIGECVLLQEFYLVGGECGGEGGVSVWGGGGVSVWGGGRGVSVWGGGGG